MEAGAVPRVAPPMVPTLTPRLLRLASDVRLVGAVREGRSGAFEVIYDRHSRGIYGFCRHMLGDADEAEDAVQHTFMAAYSDLLRSEREINLKPWLYTIARNRCYSILRARREQPSDEIEEAIGEGLATEVQRREDLRDLVNDMRQLPDEQRAALVLAEVDSLSHAEIADVLSVPREKVKALVFQARESLVASRAARDTACSEIREQLSVARGGTLRRGNLRRHLRECDGCREFKTQVEHQRKRFAALLPLAPTLAVKEAVLGATAVTGGAAAVGGGVIASGALKSGLAKGIIGALVATAGTAGTVVVATTSNLRLGSLLKAVSGAAAVPRGGARHLAGRSSSATRLHTSRAATTATGSYGSGGSFRSLGAGGAQALGFAGRHVVVHAGGASPAGHAWTPRHRRAHATRIHHVSVSRPTLASHAAPATYVPPRTAPHPAQQAGQPVVSPPVRGPHSRPVVSHDPAPAPIAHATAGPPHTSPHVGTVSSTAPAGGAGNTSGPGSHGRTPPTTPPQDTGSGTPRAPAVSTSGPPGAGDPPPPAAPPASGPSGSH